MNLMFWKKSDTTAVGEDDSQGMPEDGIAPKKSVEPNARYDEISEDTDDEPENDHATRSKPLLIIGAVSGIVMLAAIGFATWKFFLSSPQKKIASTETPAIPPPAPFSANELIKLPKIGFRQPSKTKHDDRKTSMAAPVGNAREAPIGENKIESTPVEQPQIASSPANLDAPAKTDLGLPAKIIPNIKQLQPSMLPDTQKIVQGQAPLSTHNGDLVVGGKDPQSSAMALKKMIDAMNADSDTPPKNAAK